MIIFIHEFGFKTKIYIYMYYLTINLHLNPKITINNDIYCNLSSPFLTFLFKVVSKHLAFKT